MATVAENLVWRRRWTGVVVAAAFLASIAAVEQRPSPGRMPTMESNWQLASLSRDAGPKAEFPSKAEPAPKAEADPRPQPDPPPPSKVNEHYAGLSGGREQMARMAGYTALLSKRELIGSSLSEEADVRIKLRHEPFSVYMEWLSGPEKGKEVIFVSGQNDDQVVVRLGGFKGRMLPTMKVDPFGSLAMSESRYPITKLGLVALTDTLLERHADETRNQVRPRFRREADADCAGRHCRVVVLEISHREQSPVYRKSVQWIDSEWNVPIQVVNYTWPQSSASESSASKPEGSTDLAALDEATLIEYYKYSEIDLHTPLTDADFHRANPAYHFRRN